ncbi:major capsid protein [Dipodfec virus RodF1_38]|uniref:Major capsid protein n=1 Tax=Dipodfec virus RodF1_38 TaxID=2929296 RepID=A0A976N2T0_9VIRU|nr:major capsid protein [Dipodfec virus RodF1_38]
MASVPYISHTVNGYSRYDIPENVAFSATPGILYVARCDFMNARDVVHIQAGAVVRANPTFVPTFTPYQVRLHRFFVPMMLYHPEMRVNSGKFSFENLSCNVYALSNGLANLTLPKSSLGYMRPTSLLQQLSLSSGLAPTQATTVPVTYKRTYPESTHITLGQSFVNADPLLGYWDIVRNYYAFSQVGQFMVAMQTPYNWRRINLQSTASTPKESPDFQTPLNPGGHWQQLRANLETLDHYYERSFYPADGDESRFYSRNDLLLTLIKATDYSQTNATLENLMTTTVTDTSGAMPLVWFYNSCFPSAVVPAPADRLSRLLPASVETSVSISGVNTVTQLALATRMQEYRDLNTAGGSRFSDWLETFFAAKLSHVDRPVLLYSSSFYLNSNPIFSQTGDRGGSLGTYAGELSGQSSFGKAAQRYCFDCPGYLMDLVSIRPLYYWAGIIADYARYDALDYFNPIFNEIGYQTLPQSVFGAPGAQFDTVSVAIAKEPCFNEFRSSYDRVFGSLARVPYLDEESQPDVIYSSWVMQRNADYATPWTSNMIPDFMFVNLADVNKPFASDKEDNFFLNIYYRVTRKSLVSKNFATQLSSR